MAEIKYEVIGSPVRVSANCEDISVTICWTGRTIYDDDCNDQYRDERICSAITITPGDTELTGSITWNGKTVEYVIYRNCPDPAPSSCTVTCSELDVYSVPKYIKKDYSDPIDIHYQYYLTCENEETGYIGSRTKKIGVKTIGVNDLDSSKCYEFVGEGGCKEKVCVGDKVDPCDAGNRLYLSVSLSKNSIPANKTNDDGYPVLDDDWKLIPAYDCMDADDQPTPIPDNPLPPEDPDYDPNYLFHQPVEDAVQCYDEQGNPRYKEVGGELLPNEDGYAIPIPYFTLTATISYKLVTVDDECKKVTQSGIITVPWRIPACENSCLITAMVGSKIISKADYSEVTQRTNVTAKISSKGGVVTFSIDNKKPDPKLLELYYPCCFGHYVEGGIEVSKIKEILKNRGKLDSDDDITIFYNGHQYNGDKVTYRVYVNPKTDGDCEGICQETIKYGVVKGTTRVSYETEYMSNEWVSPDSDDCSCSGLIITDEEGNKSGKYYVPYYGGRIKVTWDYVRHYISDECEEMYNYGTWDEIIAIGGCDERPKDCSVCYGHVTHYDEDVTEETSDCGCGGLSVYDTTCEVCDAECCYTGNGGKCNLLFKEQLTELWNDMFKCENGRSQLNLYRCKRCGAITPIMSDNDDCTSEMPDVCPACGFDAWHFRNEKLENLEKDYQNEVDTITEDFLKEIGVESVDDLTQAQKNDLNELIAEQREKYDALEAAVQTDEYYDTVMYEIEFDYSNEYVTTPTYECANCHAQLQSPGIGDDCEYIPPTSCPYCHHGEEGKEPLELIVGETSEWYNKVKYEFIQDCEKPCEVKERKLYDHLNIVLEACESGEMTYVVKYTETVDYIGEGCSPSEVKYGSETITVIAEENNTGIERTLINDERITVVQKPGPCKEKSECGCGGLDVGLLNSNGSSSSSSSSSGSQGGSSGGGSSTAGVRPGSDSDDDELRDTYVNFILNNTCDYDIKVIGRIKFFLEKTENGKTYWAQIYFDQKQPHLYCADILIPAHQSITLNHSSMGYEGSITQQPGWIKVNEDLSFMNGATIFGNNTSNTATETRYQLYVYTYLSEWPDTGTGLDNNGVIKTQLVGSNIFNSGTASSPQTYTINISINSATNFWCKN